LGWHNRAPGKRNEEKGRKGKIAGANIVVVVVVMMGWGVMVVGWGGWWW